MMHWLFHIIVGGLLIAAGALSVSLGWHFISKWNVSVKWRLLLKKTKRKRYRDVLFVVLGLILVGVGGPWTTFSWNLRDNYINKQALLLAAAKEWKQNDLRNDEIEFTLKLIRKKDYYRMFPLPIPTNQELTRAIDITQLKWRRIQQSPLDLDFFLHHYTKHIDFLSTRLHLVNIKSYNREKYRNAIESIFGKGDAYPEYLKCHQLVEKIFMEKYPGFLERVDWLVLEMIDRTEEKEVETMEAEDPNDQSGDNITARPSD